MVGLPPLAFFFPERIISMNHYLHGSMTMSSSLTVSALLSASSQQTIVMELSLEPVSAHMLLHCALSKQPRYECECECECECDAPGGAVGPVAVDHDGLPVVVITHEGDLREGRALLERIITIDCPERVRIYMCDSPNAFAREKIEIIRGMAVALAEEGKEKPLLKAAVWSGVRQAEVLGRIADNEFEFRRAVPQHEGVWIDDEECQRVIALLRDFPAMHPLQVEAYAAALRDAADSCYAVASAWARRLASELRGMKPSAEELVMEICEPVSGNRILYMLKQSWYQFYAEHGREELCLVCDPEDCHWPPWQGSLLHLSGSMRP